MGATHVAIVTVSVGDDAEYLVVTDRVGIGTLPVTMLCGTAVETIYAAGTIFECVGGVDLVTATAPAHIAGGASRGGGVIPWVFFVVELGHGEPV